MTDACEYDGPFHDYHCERCYGQFRRGTVHLCAPPVDAALRDATTRAIRALVPVLPVDGGPKRGYRVSGADVRGSRTEIEAAARAVCELHRVLKGSA